MILLVVTVSAADTIDTASASVNLSDILPWLEANWASVALIVSEVAALISVKYTGIVKTVLSVIGQLITKKSKP